MAKDIQRAELQLLRKMSFTSNCQSDLYRIQVSSSSLLFLLSFPAFLLILVSLASLIQAEIYNIFYGKWDFAMQTNADGHIKKSTFCRATFKIDQFDENHPRENTH